MKTISGYVRNFQSTGSCAAPATRPIYAFPSHLDALFLCSGQWLAMWSNPAITIPAYSRSIVAMTDVAAGGRFTFSLPQTSETFQPNDQLVKWTVLDPLTGIAFTGEVQDVIPPAGADLKTLVDAYDWVITPTIQVSVGATNFRTGEMTFTASVGIEQDVQILPPFGSATYVPIISGATDDLGENNYNAYVLMQSRTPSQFTIRISDPVPALRSVKIPWAIYG